MSLCWLNYVKGVYLVHVSLLFIGQQGLGHFFRYQPLLLIGWRNVQILRQPEGKRQPQYKQQANPLLSIHSYSSLVISRNKNTT